MDKEIYKMDDNEEQDIIHEKMGNEEMMDFKELAPRDNMLVVWLNDFPQLADEAAGSDVCFIVRGTIKSQEDTDQGPMINVSLVDAELMHGKGKSMKPGGGGRFAKMEGALMRKGYSKESAGAITASAGRAKYGKERFQKMAATGLRRYYRGGGK